MPKDIKKILYSYQIKGVKWMYNHIKNNKGCILADDMGLGKTLQIIVLIICLLKNKTIKKDFNIMIIAPKTLIMNWKKEFKKFAPYLNVINYAENRYEIPNNSILLVPDSLIITDYLTFKKKKYSLLVVDEAHSIKNIKGRKNKIINSLKAKNKIAVTGTPIMNNLSEYWSLFDFVNPGYFGEFKIFKKYIQNPIEKYQDKESLDILIKITQPFILHRLKDDVLSLPKKIIIDRFCKLLPKQEKQYRKLFSPLGNLLKIKENENKQSLIPPRPKVQQAITVITKAKQLCDHPKQFQYEDNSEKLFAESNKIIETLKIVKLHKDKGERGLIFTHIIEYHLLFKALKEQNINVLFLHGKCTIKEREEIVTKFQDPSSKVDVVIVSLFVGGLGLNLPAANYIVMFNPWWNFALQDQAFNRAHRIGLEHNIYCYRLFTLNSWEHEFMTLIQYKNKLSDTFLNNIDFNAKILTHRQVKKILKLHIKKCSIRYEKSHTKEKFLSRNISE